MTLDPEHYFSHSSFQFGLANEVLDKLSFKGNEAILDLGCGDGKITDYLATCLPQGSVIGLDNSNEMISFAQAKFSRPNLTFVAGDARCLPWKNQFDWILSFSCIHWIHPQEMVFQSIKQALKEGGKANLITFPRDSRYFKYLEETLNKEPFCQYRRENSHLTPEEYRIILDKIGFSKAEILVEERIASYDSLDDLKDYIRGWQPSLIPLPEQLQEPFLDTLVSNSASHQIPKGDGRIHLPFATVKIDLVL